MNSASSIPWRASLVTRFVLLWSLLLGGLVLLCGWLIWRGGRESLIQTWRENLRHDAAAVELKLQSAVTGVMRDTVYLAKVPTLREFVRAQGTPQQEQWRKLIEDEFHALLEGKPSYFQVRLIGLADGGREVIRLDNNQGRIETTPASGMQQKGDRDYFQEALKMPPDTVYVSAINLNQEFGKVTEPHIPTLRTAMQVKRETGEVYGVVVINVDMSSLFTELADLPGNATRLVLAGPNGDFFIHPDPARTFGTDLGHAWRYVPEQSAETGDQDLKHAAPFSLAPHVPGKLTAVLTVPAGEWLKLLEEARDKAAVATGITALGGILVIALLSRWLAGRLHRVTAAIAAYEAGQETNLPGEGADELGRLAATFHTMAMKVRDQVTRLDAARREAEEATRLKEEFLAVMSHEIRTPMNAVTGLIRVLERNQPAKHQEPVIRSLRIAARNLMALLNDALDYTRLKAGGLDFERQVFSLRQHLHDLAMTHRPVAMQKDLSLELEIDPALPPAVQGDPVRLMQILNNLVSNALKFTDQGHVSIAVRPLENGQVEFAVEDTGVGIPEEEQARIFAPFTQVRRPDGRQFDGSGLGLSIARELVERQGGSLAVRSRAGEGTCFTAVLPLPAAESAPESPQPAVNTVPNLTGLRLLYVEDVASNRHVMASILDETGVSLTFSETGGEALAAVKENDYDAVLLDLQLPDMTGIEVAQGIKAARPELPIIAVTAQAGSAARLECEAAGMGAVVLKPVEPDQLFAAIRQHTAQRREEPSLDEFAAIFGSKPDKFRAVLESLAGEFRNHAETLSRALGEGDTAAIRSLRHRMHTALVQMKLTTLTKDMEALAGPEGVNGDTALHQRCVAAIRAAGVFLERSAAGMAVHAAK
jgi:signal transduction histidine kinase/DNA-binding response OmpR family regulator